MRNDDNELEKYLSEFRPREVRALEAQPERKNTTWLRRLAAAMMLAALVGTGLWYAEEERKTERAEGKQPLIQREFNVAEPEVNSILLTRMALEDPQKFEEKMNEASRDVLPDLRGQQSTLSVLAK